MANQRFYASPHDTFTWPDGTVGHRSGGPMDCLGPFAKVTRCKIDKYLNPDGTPVRFTCYATRIADTYFSIPACCQIRGKYITGFFFVLDGSITFAPYGRYKYFLDNVFPTKLSEPPVKPETVAEASIVSPGAV